MNNYFCNAKQRPTNCKYKTNLCCLICVDRPLCVIEHNECKITPCIPNHYDDTDICPFQI